MNRLLDGLFEGLARTLMPWPAPSLAVAGHGGEKPGLEVFNVGGPRSRTRREVITASLFPREGQARCLLGARRVGDVWALHSGGRPLRETAFEVLAEQGYADPAEAFENLEGIPRSRLHCRACTPQPHLQGAGSAWSSRPDFLRKALVLGKCRSGLYDPDGPVIWTENRLGQWLELYEIQRPFYR